MDGLKEKYIIKCSLKWFIKVSRWFEEGPIYNKLGTRLFIDRVKE